MHSRQKSLNGKLNAMCYYIPRSSNKVFVSLGCISEGQAHKPASGAVLLPYVVPLGLELRVELDILPGHNIIVDRTSKL
jgi:hypothetical protein